MYRYSFINWTEERTRSKILEYQKTKDKELFSLLQAKYDKYLLKLAWDFWPRARAEDLEDIYHAAIAGFGESLLKFKTSIPPGLIIAHIRAYVKREIEKEYISKRPEDMREDKNSGAELVPPNPEDIIDLYFVLNSKEITDQDRELIFLRFEENMSFADIGQKLGISRYLASRRLASVLKKLHKTIREDGLYENHDQSISE